MRDSLPFLLRLGLDVDTDARSIRRAYARELKQIDQEQDAAGFQELREAYDHALQWLAWREQNAAAEAEPEPAPEREPPATPDYGQPRTPVTLGAAPAPAPVQGASPPDEAQQLAAAVFGEFRAAMAALLQQYHVQQAPLWQQALRHSLDDERLLNITARTYFEVHIAQLLAAGWRPGHEVLLVVACHVFHWGEDRRRLQQLGYAGALIDQAIDQRNIFDRLPESELMIHRAAIALLRKDDAPSDYQLRGDMPYVEKLMAYFPVWMSMIVNLNVVEQWRASYRALPPPKKSWLPKLDLDISPRVGWILFIVLLQVARMIFNHVGSDDHAAPPMRLPQLSAPANTTPDFTPLPAKLQREVAARIALLPLQLGPGEHAAEFNIELDGQGNIDQSMMYRTSGSVSYDEAASKALRASQPFPPETPRKFQVTFTPSTVPFQ